LQSALADAATVDAARTPVGLFGRGHVRSQANMSDSLGDAIRQARLDKDLTLRELARRLNKAPSYLSDIEYDRRVPSESVLKDICGVLELDFDRMLALAGRFDENTEQYLKQTPAAGVVFRKFSDLDLGEAELKKVDSFIDRLGQKRERPPE
jgi:transcriptional regulator with XRE-family HTH domain